MKQKIALAVCVLIGALLVGAFMGIKNADFVVPERAMESGPASANSCARGIRRASQMPVEDLGEVLHGHLPSWLPEGIGLIAAYGGGEALGGEAGGYWADAGCRQLDLYIRGSEAGGEQEGWSEVIGASAAEKQCGTADLGDTDCWNASRDFGPYSITVQTLGLTKEEVAHVLDFIT